MKKEPIVKVVRAFTYPADTIRRVREAYEMTEERFAAFVGVSPRDIAGWEAGTSRPAGTLEERAFDNVMDEARARFPDLKVGLEPNPEVEESRRASNP